MPMPAEVIAQVYCLARQAKATQTLAFTNIRDEDPDILYTGLDRDEDDVDPDQDHDECEGVDGGGEEDTNNNEYDPEQDSDKDP